VALVAALAIGAVVIAPASAAPVAK